MDVCLREAPRSNRGESPLFVFISIFFYLHVGIWCMDGGGVEVFVTFDFGIGIGIWL